MKTLFCSLGLYLLVFVGKTQLPSYVPLSGLMGWWPFNNDANDESANTYDGTVYGPVIASDRFGLSNAAYNFNGTIDGITMPSLNMSTSSAMSISVWVNPASLSSHTYHEIIRQDNGYTRNPDFLLSFQDKGSFLAFGTGTSVSYTELDVPISPIGFINEWTHIVAVYDGTNRRIYVNASVVGSDLKAGTIQYSALTFTVGCEPTYLETHEFFSGQIDDIGIWSRALTEQEIWGLYNATAPKPTDITQLEKTTPPTVYPNPSTGIFTIKTTQKNIAKVRVKDATGRVVKTINNVNSINAVVELDKAVSGIYFLQIELESVAQPVFEKVMVQ